MRARKRYRQTEEKKSERLTDLIISPPTCHQAYNQTKLPKGLQYGQSDRQSHRQTVCPSNRTIITGSLYVSQKDR